MHRILALSLAATVGTALAATPLPATLPTPQAGLWEMKTAVAEMGGMIMTFESCMGGSVEELLRRPEVEDANCQDMQVDHQGNRLTARAICTIEGSRAEIVSDFTGDFKQSYSGTIHSTYSPPLQGLQKTTAKVDGRWVAPNCLPGQKPGDSRMKSGVTVPGVGNIDLNEMMKNLPNFGR